METKFLVDFKYNSPLPMAIQDFFGGIISDHVIISCGCEGKPLPEGRGLRSLSKKTYIISVSQLKNKFLSDSPMNVPFTKINNFPGDSRQKGFSLVYKNMLFCWGGLQYTPTKVLNKEILKSKKKNTKSFNDGYVLYKDKNKWLWKKLPDLPYFICGASLSMIDDYIYLFGGADYYDSTYNTCNDRNNETPRFGARLYKISGIGLLNFLFNMGKEPQWEEMAPIGNETTLGNPRMNHVTIAANDKLYVIGGVSGRPFGGQFFSIIDNWCYSPETNSWTKLPNCPSSNTNWQSTILYKNRYILLIGGAHTWNKRQKNTPRTYLDIDLNEHKGFGNLRCNKPTGYKGIMSGDIICFDIEKNCFCSFDNINGGIPLPLDLNNPLLVNLGDDLIAAIGGEIEIDRSKCGNLATILNTYLSNVCLVGKIYPK